MTHTLVVVGLATALLATLIMALRAVSRAFRQAKDTHTCPFKILFGARSKPSTTAAQPGLGWSEIYIGGSTPSEEEFIVQAMRDINEVQKRNKASGHSQSYGRAFHAKIQAGIANASFVVSENLPAQLRVGFLQPGKSYRAAVRLSSASGVVKPDTAKDLRGLAMRVYCDGDKGIDFLGTNGSASHARDARQFIDFAKAGSGSKFLMLPRLLWHVGFFETVRMMKTVIRQTARKVKSLSTETYFSRSPYAFGDYAVKFQLTPSSSADANFEPSDSYLRDDIVERLKKGPVVFDFQVQYFLDEGSTPIEDGSVEWSSSPLITIAQLVIPQQDLSTAQAAADQKAVESLEFNPWNTTAGFRPLGSLNRARRLVYQASVALRKTVRSNAD